MSAIEEKLGKRVAVLRKSAGLTQARLAELVGVQPEHISRIETGARGVSLETLANIAEVLDLQLHELVRLSDAELPADKAIARLLWFASRLSEPEIELLMTVGAAVLDVIKTRRLLTQRGE
jgi:transcriptional regulator with XRE-family HTH domain